MKDGELYVSPLTFEDVKEYSKINYCAKFCTDDRETKRADTTKGLVGHVHEVGRITKTYISHRLVPWLNLTNNDPLVGGKLPGEANNWELLSIVLLKESRPRSHVSGVASYNKLFACVGMVKHWGGNKNLLDGLKSLLAC
ncbi:hypothetical protein DSO57_1009573 [Entomophthora muscae]|uniref:Uncharacterized protein n=1 Tax=Entomophthora muscae TaxID=34485 RepID=A0ACC2RXS6_9FUNG|nr:hypothetical protein DSO57_1009573 [Entomophthora muscae]